MTDDEVQLIYDYLHENYKYEDGDLITKNNIANGHKKGIVIGNMYFGGKGNAYLRIQLPVHKVSIKLSHAIYLYHHKEKPRCLIYIDGNIMNNKIENLSKRNSIPRNGYTFRIKKPKGFIARKESKLGVFSVKIKRDSKQVYIGSYSSEEKAKEVYIFGSELWDKNKLTKQEWLLLIREKYPLQGREKFIRKIDRILPVGVGKHGNKFRASICFNSKKRHLGLFNTAEEAHEAYLKAGKDHKNDAR